MQWQNSGDRIFVFGSNLAGRHGKGAALYARRHCGAIYGQGEGLQGRSYAIPTKDERLQTLSIERIAAGINRFIAFCIKHPELQFDITPVGCGLAGYKQSDIRPLFHLEGLPENAHLLNWDEVL